MLEKFKKHSVKILVFVINVLLAAIAVFIIRDKDQARLLEKAQNENIGNGSAENNALPSFENTVNVEDSASIDPSQTESPVQTAPVDSGAVVPSDPVPQNTAPVPQAKQPNAKTKTS